MELGRFCGKRDVAVFLGREINEVHGGDFVVAFVVRHESIVERQFAFQSFGSCFSLFLCLGIVNVEILGEGDARRGNEFHVARAFHGDAVGAGLVGAQFRRKQFAFHAEASHAARECGWLRLRQFLYGQCQGLDAALYLNADAASAIEKGIGEVERIVLLDNGAVERQAGNCERTGFLREYEILQNSPRAVGRTVKMLHAHLYLVAGDWYFLRDEVLEIGAAREGRVGQAHTEAHVNAISEKHCFLFVNGGTCGRDVDKEVALRYRRSALLHARRLNHSAALIFAAPAAGRLRGLRGGEVHGVGAKSLAADRNGSRADGDLPVFLGANDIGETQGLAVRHFSVDELHAAVRRLRRTAQHFKICKRGRREMLRIFRRDRKA